jgi:hypothetical protein
LLATACASVKPVPGVDSRAQLASGTQPPSGVHAAVTTPTPPPQVPANAGHGKIAVAIVVDQLAGWIAAERWPHLPNGGFARLRREGTWVKDLSYLHATTETAPGHATLYTGRAPFEHRIVANAVWRTDLGKTSSLLEDAATRLVGPGGVDPNGANGVSLAKLNGPTLADTLLERDPEAVVVGLSLKDRGALFACGRRPTACVWYNELSGTLASSTAFLHEAPPRLPAFAAQYAQVLSVSESLAWTLLDADFVKAHATTPDDQLGELSSLGGRSFPHAVPAGSSAFSSFRLHPKADALLVNLAIGALALRRPEHPMLLAVSFSTNDYVGHSFGPDSWESWNELLSLDRELERLFLELDRRVGKDGYSVVLSADHGMVPLPEVVQARTPEYCRGKRADPYQRPCKPGLRVNAAVLKAALQSKASALLNTQASMIQDIIDSRVILSDAARRLSATDRARLDALILGELRANPSIASAFPIAAFNGTCPPPSDESVAALVCRAVPPAGNGAFYDVPGDFYIVFKPGHFWGAGEGGTHGAPYPYDRSVPLLTRYPNGAGGQVVDRALFGSYYASLWYALSGETLTLPYGGVIGAGPTP